MVILLAAWAYNIILNTQHFEKKSSLFEHNSVRIEIFLFLLSTGIAWNDCRIYWAT
jgi:hypothetical protein